HRFVYFFVVDTCVLRCYKPLKDKLFGGESPNELQKSRVRPQTCLAGQACCAAKSVVKQHPTTPGGENEAVFTSFLVSRVMRESADPRLNMVPSSLLLPRI